MPETERWRVGRTLGRTLYIQGGEEPSKDDRCVGLLDTRELAEQVVAAVNGPDAGELIRLRNRITALEANGSELLDTVTSFDDELDDARKTIAGLMDDAALRDAAIDAAVGLVREWMTPGAPVFSPSHAAEVEALLRKTLGERVVAALSAPHSPADAPPPVTAGIEAHGETTEAQEGSR
jgi:hypothetical protein